MTKNQKRTKELKRRTKCHGNNTSCLTEHPRLRALKLLNK